MNESKIEVLEEFLLSPEKETFIEKLPKNSVQRNYFEFLQSINKKGKGLTKEELENLELFKKTEKIEAKSIYLRFLLRSLENTKNDAERKGIMQEINKLTFNYSFEYQKPQSHFLSEQGQKEISMQPSTLDLKYIDYKPTIESCYTGPKNFSKLNPEAYLELDLKKISKNWDNARIFLNKAFLPDFEGLAHFIKQSIEAREKDTKQDVSIDTMLGNKFYERITLNQMEELRRTFSVLNTRSEFVLEYSFHSLI